MQIKLGRAKRRKLERKKKVISAENAGNFETHNHGMRGENVQEKEKRKKYIQKLIDEVNEVSTAGSRIRNISNSQMRVENGRWNMLLGTDRLPPLTEFTGPYCVRFVNINRYGPI